mmetsp:Transcript_52641/g.104503  ORF Transcript_52641/g.104503 Transcript_52641/m.104503 type:complete len:470 (-) Transcript_52641:693-2102(-)
MARSPRGRLDSGVPEPPRRDSSISLFSATEDDQLCSHATDLGLQSTKPNPGLHNIGLANFGLQNLRLQDGPFAALGLVTAKRKMFAVAGVVALVTCIALPRLVSQSMQPRESLSPPRQKSIVIGSRHVPKGLQPAPKPKIMFVGHPSYHCVYPMAEDCPARELFWNAEVHEVVTENLMQVGRGLLVHADRDLVRNTVAAGFRNISLNVMRHAPKIADQMFRLRISEAEKNLVLTSLRLISLPEVQRLGFEVAMAIRRSLSHDRGNIQHVIEEMLEAKLDDISNMVHELISPPLLKLWGPGHARHQWDMTLESENIDVMTHVDGGKFYGSMNATFYANAHGGAPGYLPREEKAYGAWGGILEEGRALLDVIRLIVRSSGNGDLEVPGWAASLTSNVDMQDLGRELLSCELHEEDGMDNFMKAIFCPLKYGTQGIDALRAVAQVRRITMEPPQAKNENGGIADPLTDSASG